MKRLISSLILVFALAVVSAPVFAATTATFGDQNSSKDYRMKADTDGVVTFAQDTGIKYPYQEHTSGATNTLAAAESGTTIQDSVGATHVLPAAAVGLQFTISAGYSGGSGLPVTATVDTASTSDKIVYSITGTKLAAGDKAVSGGQAGDSLTVMCTSANEWVITSKTGTWTDGN